MYTYNNNYYTATMNDTTERAALSGNVQADVCVIGAGLAGLSTAWELVSRRKVRGAAEAGRVAWGASGRNGGFVLQGWSEGLSSDRAALRKATAAALFKSVARRCRHCSRHDRPSSTARLLANPWKIECGSLRGWR